MDKVFLIFADDIDDYCEIKGYIKGDEEDAKKYCEELNSQGDIKRWWEYLEIENIKG